MLGGHQGNFILKQYTSIEDALEQIKAILIEHENTKPDNWDTISDEFIICAVSHLHTTEDVPEQPY
jgi:hypothetical protein